MDQEKFTLEFDDGGSVECEILGLFDVKGVDYIALADLNSDDVYLYRYVTISNSSSGISTISKSSLFSLVT